MRAMDAPDRTSPPAANRRAAPAILALAAALAALAPFLALSARAHPANDDFSMAITGMEHGVLGSVAWWYRTWSGRYFACFLATASPLTWRSLTGWRWMTFADLLVFPAGAWLLASALAPPSVSRTWRAALGLGLAALHYGGMPDPAGGLYWMNGVVCYLVGEGLAAGALGCALRARGGPGAAAAGWTFGGALLAALAVGTNEVVALLLAGCLVLVAARRRWSGGNWRPAAIVAAVAIACTAVLLLAPGTALRLRTSGRAGRHLFDALATAAAAAGPLALRWTLSPVLPAALLAGLAAARARARGEAWSLPHPALAGPLLAAAWFATILLPCYGGGSLEPHTLNLSHALFAGGLPFLAASAGARLGLPSAADGSAGALAGMAWGALVTLALLPATPLRTAWDDLLSGRAARYDAAMLARYELLERCFADVCDVPPIPDRPRTLFWFEDAAEEWRDAPSQLRYKDGTFAYFFGKPRIRVVPPLASVR